MQSFYIDLDYKKKTIFSFGIKKCEDKYNNNTTKNLFEWLRAQTTTNIVLYTQDSVEEIEKQP